MTMRIDIGHMTREEINKLMSELQKIKYKVPSKKRFKIPFRGDKVSITVINYDKEEPNLIYVIQKFGRSMISIDECTVTIKDKTTFINIRGERKIVVKKMKIVRNGNEFNIELNESIKNSYPVNHPVIGKEPFEFNGRLTDLDAKYVTVNNNFEII